MANAGCERIRLRHAGHPPHEATAPAHVLVVAESAPPGEGALRRAAWVCRRLQAVATVVVIIERDARWDELEVLRARRASEGLESSVVRLRGEGVAADGQLVTTWIGEAGGAAQDLAAELQPELVLVLARRASRLLFLPGSRIAHHLLRTFGGPVVVVPDRRSVRLPRWLKPRGGRPRLTVLHSGRA